LLRKIFTAIGILAVLAASVAGYRYYLESKKEIVSVLVVEQGRSISFIPQYIAMSQGFFDEQNLKVKLTTIKDKDKFTAYLAGNEADIILADLAASKLTQPKQIRSKTIAFACLTTKSEYFLLAHEADPSFNWEKLKGKTVIAGPPEGTAEIILEEILKQHKLFPQHDLTIIWNIPEYLKPGAFAAKTGHYVVLPEPVVSKEEAKERAAVVASLGKDGGELPLTVYTVKRSFLKKYSQAVQGFTDAVYKAQIWLSYHNAEETAREVARFFPDIDKKILVKAIQRYMDQNTWSKNPKISVKGYDRFQNMVKNCGELICTVDAQHAINNEFAQKSVATVEYIPENKQEKKFDLKKIFGVILYHAVAVSGK